MFLLSEMVKTNYIENYEAGQSSPET